MRAETAEKAATIANRISELEAVLKDFNHSNFEDDNESKYTEIRVFVLGTSKVGEGIAFKMPITGHFLGSKTPSPATRFRRSMKELYKILENDLAVQKELLAALNDENCDDLEDVPYA